MALTAVVALTVASVTPALAITDGQPDGDGHPYVGLMIAKDASGTPLWRCSGTMMSATVFMTAGHCTEAPAASVEIWFDAGPVPFGNWTGGPCARSSGYPCKGDASGKPHTHPDYDPNAFYFRDLGVVVLNKAVKMKTYGKLPARDSLDALKPSNSTRFTAVGYGLQRSSPSPIAFLTSAIRERMYAEPHLLQINTGFTGDFSLLLSNNASSGGTCFGDSGGPNFVGSSNVVAAVTSFGLNSTCGGTGGVFRVDRGFSLDWLAEFGLTP
ncbi:MAG TPA: trypsin-like serine protease [Candidatus Limnocylindria bacterium]|nr:trypsin-like serine protease [Candidatus Limnocylindria bacterium]